MVKGSGRSVFAGFSGLIAALLVPVSSLAHPSGLPGLRERGEYLVATSADWLFWDWHPSIVFGILAMTGLYTLTITRWRTNLSGGEPLNKNRVRAFYASMVLQWLLLDGPLHHLSDELLFTAHMFQHLGLQLIWAPLFLWSWHPWQLRPLVKNKIVRAIAYKITRPVPAFFIYNLTTVIWHAPPLYNLALEVHPWHITEHLLFMSTACIFWWPLLGCLKEVPRPSYGRQIFYVFANMFAMKILGIGISLQDDVIYTYYLTVPRVWGLTAIADQQIGGLLMWLPGGLLLWGGLGYVFIQIAFRGTPKRGTSGIASVDEVLKQRKDAKSALVSLLVCGLLVVASGCGKKQAEAPTKAPENAAKATGDDKKAEDPGKKAEPAAENAEKPAEKTDKPSDKTAEKPNDGAPTFAGVGKGNKLKFEVRLSPPKPKVGELFQAVTIAREVTSSAPLLGAEVEVDATMPHHGHGMMTDPVHKELGGGAYLTKGMKLHMHGKWTFVIKAKSKDTTDELKVVWEQDPESL